MKQVNENGFWRIENNPISQVGVFPYLGKNISDKLEPNKIYFVYRPAEELFAPETLESFNSTPLPLVDEHEMLGDGATPAENKGIHGVISNVRQDGKLLVGDISIYSETMKDEINRGKKDLSMGYYCEYDLEEGDYEGQHYDAVQRNLRGNHVALVDQGRCGHAVRVYDHFALDADFKEEDHPRDEDGKFTKKGQSTSKGLKNSNLEKVQNSIKNIPEKVKQKVITQYTGGHYYEMNEYLRGYVPKDKSMFKTPQERKEAVQILTKLTLQPMKGTILTRLSSVDDLEGLVSDEVLEKIQQRNYRDISAIQNELVGKTFENKGFTSTSDGNLATASWLKNKPIKFILHAPDGTLGVDVSNESIQSKLNSEFDLTKEENEVILAPGTKFKITGVNSPKEDSLRERENKQFFMTEYEREKFNEQDFNPYDAPLTVHAEVISPEINDDYMKKVEEEYSEETEPTKTRDKKKRIVHSVAKNFNDKYKEVFLKVHNVIKNLGSKEELASKNLGSNEELTSVFNEIRTKDIPALSKEVDNLEKTGEHLVAQKKLTKLLFNLPAPSSNGTYDEESLDKFKLFFIEKTQRPQFRNINDAKKELFSLMDIMEHFTNEVADRKVSKEKAGFYQSYMGALKNDIETRLDLLNPKDAQQIRYLTNDLKTMHPLAAAQEYITRKADFWERSFLESRERFLTNKNKNIEKIKSLGSTNSAQDTTCEDENKNTANDSGYNASLKGADSVNKEDNKMTEELKARDGDLVIKHDDEEEVKDASVDKRELIREIGAIAGQAGMSEELVRTLMQKAEQLAYNGSEQSEATDACGKDEDAEMKGEEIKQTEDADEEKDEEKISKLVEKKVEDALNGIDFLTLVEAKKNMLEKVRPLVGDFDASKMTNNDIAKYACDKLNIKATSDSANDVLDCYLNMKGNTKIYSTADSMDESVDDIIARYKRGE